MRQFAKQLQIAMTPGVYTPTRKRYGRNDIRKKFRRSTCITSATGFRTAKISKYKNKNDLNCDSPEKREVREKIVEFDIKWNGDIKEHNHLILDYKSSHTKWYKQIGCRVTIVEKNHENYIYQKRRIRHYPYAQIFENSLNDYVSQKICFHAIFADYYCRFKGNNDMKPMSDCKKILQNNEQPILILALTNCDRDSENTGTDMRDSYRKKDTIEFEEVIRAANYKILDEPWIKYYGEHNDMTARIYVLQKRNFIDLTLSF